MKQSAGDSMATNAQRRVCLCGNLGDAVEYCGGGVALPGPHGGASASVTGCCGCPAAALSPLSTE